MAALAAEAGVPKPSIQIYEGGTLPNVGAALRLARALGVTVEAIWGTTALPPADDLAAANAQPAPVDVAEHPEAAA